MSPLVMILVVCCVVPVAGLATFQGLLAIWAATSHAPWFLRALAAYGGVMLFVPIRAYEPAAIFAIGSLLIVTAMVVPRGWSSRPGSAAGASLAAEAYGKLRYGLRDLFLAVLLVGLLLFGWQTIDQGYSLADWLAFLTAGALLAAIVVLSYRTAAGPRRWLSAAALLIVVPSAPFAAWATGPHTQAEAVWHATGVLWNGAYNIPDIVHLMIVQAVVATLVVVSIIGGRTSSANAMQKLWAKLARCGVAMLAAAWSLLLAWIYWQMLWLTPFPAPVVGSTNHYPRLVAIAAALEGNRNQGIAPATNVAQPTAEAAALLQSPNYVVLDNRLLTKTGLDEHQDTASRMRVLSRRFAADATTAAAAGQFDQAAEWGIANVLLGTMLNRGGDSSDAFVGSSCQGVGLIGMAEVRQSLSPDARQSVLAALGRSIAEAEDPETILARTCAYSERAYGWFDRYQHVQWTLLRIAWPDKQIMQMMRQRKTVLTQLLMTDLAIRQFHDDRGQLPAKLSVLVPDYLPTVPLDPYGSGSLQYRIENGAFVLYSVGEDGRDDGGRFTNRSNYHRTGFDYDLDTHTRP